MSLVEKLKQLQGTKTQSEFATELGIDQSTLSRIYSGERRIGLEAARQIKNRFPDLSFEIAAFLLAGDMPTIHN